MSPTHEAHQTPLKRFAVAQKVAHVTSSSSDDVQHLFAEKNLLPRVVEAQTRDRLARIALAPDKETSSSPTTEKDFAALIAHNEFFPKRTFKRKPRPNPFDIFANLDAHQNEDKAEMKHDPK